MKEQTTILIAEDSDELRDAYQDEFGGIYQLIFAKDGSEALDCLRNGLRPDLIISDLRMPILSGDKFIRSAQSENLISCPLIVASSAYDGKLVAEQVQADLFVEKVNLKHMRCHSIGSE